MKRLTTFLRAVLVLAVWPGFVTGQVPSLVGFQGATMESGEKPAMVLHAAPQPDPMLRYRFWPASVDRRNENAMPLLARALILAVQVPPEKQKVFADKYQQWSEMPIDQLPIEEVEALLAPYGRALDELGRAENLMQIDYPLMLDDLSASEIVAMLLPEIQESRNLARLLALRARLAIRQQRWDDMVRDCRIGFRLGEMTGHSTDFLIGRLVGFAISSTMLAVIETAMQQPECPNLYWALASLPSKRLFETRESLEFESTLISRLFRGVGELPNQPIGAEASREKLRSIIDQADRSLFDSNARKLHSELAKLFAGSYVVMMADPSRELLAATSQWGDRAFELSAPEAVLRATLLKFSRARDHWVAWSFLPDELSAEYEKDWQDSFQAISYEREPLIALISLLTPSIQAARSAGRRSEQHLNWLITIEALRMHAASSGELPESIDRLRPVPAWNDTIANQPFEYSRISASEATFTRASRFPNDTETSYQITLKGVQ